MNYAEIKYCDIANGAGVRTSLFVSGCRHCCPGCFNGEAQNFDYGKPFDDETAKRIIDSCRPDYVSGLTLLGGEPMEPENQTALLPFLQQFRNELPNKTVWCYSGSTWEELFDSSSYHTDCTEALLSCLDVLVDGPFVQHLHEVTLRFRGSSNQRIIDVPATLQSGQIVLWSDGKLFSDHTTMDPRA